MPHHPVNDTYGYYILYNVRAKVHRMTIPLCLTLLNRERSNSPALILLRLRQFDGAKLLLILLHIILQCQKQTLGMLGSHDNAAFHLRLLHARHHLHKICHKFTT